MHVSYLEMEGAGNRIVVVDQRQQNLPPPPPATLRRLVGMAAAPAFDQLMWVGPAAGGDASYRVFNRDGSEAEQCGNGVRCVAWMLARDGGRRSFVLDGPAGSVEARVLDDGRIAVDMGAPEFEPARIPFDAAGTADRYELDVGDRVLEVAVLSMGNPHCIVDVESVADADVGGLGARIETHPRFPARTNVGFRQIRGRDEVELRVFERGVGETLACGTGACAAVVAGRRQGRLDREVRVRLPGGQLVVSWQGDGEPVWLTGNAELIQEGAIDL